MRRRTFIGTTIGGALAGLFAPMLTKLGKKPATAVCATTGTWNTTTCVIYVDCKTGNDNGPGTIERPLATLDTAFQRMASHKGGTILVAPGHNFKMRVT